MRYPAPILCLAVSPDETHIAAGMTDGTLSVRRRQPKASEADGESSLAKTILQSGTYDSFLGGSLPTIGEGRVKGKGKAKPLGDVNELRVESRRTKRLKNYDKYLKSFKYSAALDAVLKKPVLRLLVKYVSDPRFGEMVCDVAKVVIEMYTPILGQSPVIDNLFVRLRKKVAAEIRFQKELIRTKGALDMILASAASVSTVR
ncbi:U3 small nucleolar RNA-associated protein 15 [Paramarasmius palmivorus]|uniref:U3 small nucleolar RNA-associated protein 15 n=1 Tax=Paramarasmius palmivorus TaxID=297713 RepID=A0AAW0E9G1_9AGAR